MALWCGTEQQQNRRSQFLLQEDRGFVCSDDEKTRTYMSSLAPSLPRHCMAKCTRHQNSSTSDTVSSPGKTGNQSVSSSSSLLEKDQHQVCELWDGTTCPEGPAWDVPEEASGALACAAPTSRALL